MEPIRIRLRPAPAPRILDFDIENRPLSYMGNDYTSAEITAIAWSWIGDDVVSVRLLGVDDPLKMLEDFRSAYEAADIVTGHYIIKHDLPLINGAMLEYKLLPLPPKLVSDTKLHLTKKKDLSASQESLATMFGLPEAKHHLANPEWREANRLTPEGIAATRKRVVDDVVQHKALRVHLLSIKALDKPTVWVP